MKTLLMVLAAGAVLNLSAAAYAQEAEPTDETTVDEPAVEEPAVVDDGVEYDPVIAQSGAGGGEVQRGVKSLFGRSEATRDDEPTYKLFWKNGTLYKIPQ